MAKTEEAEETHARWRASSPASADCARRGARAAASASAPMICDACARTRRRDVAVASVFFSPRATTPPHRADGPRRPSARARRSAARASSPPELRLVGGRAAHRARRRSSTRATHDTHATRCATHERECARPRDAPRAPPRAPRAHRVRPPSPRRRGGGASGKHRGSIGEAIKEASREDRAFRAEGETEDEPAPARKKDASREQGERPKTRPHDVDEGSSHEQGERPKGVPTSAAEIPSAVAATHTLSVTVEYDERDRVPRCRAPPHEADTRRPPSAVPHGRQARHVWRPPLPPPSCVTTGRDIPPSPRRGGRMYDTDATVACGTPRTVDPSHTFAMKPVHANSAW